MAASAPLQLLDASDARLATGPVEGSWNRREAASATSAAPSEQQQLPQAPGKPQVGGLRGCVPGGRVPGRGCQGDAHARANGERFASAVRHNHQAATGAAIPPPRPASNSGSAAATAASLPPAGARAGSSSSARQGPPSGSGQPLAKRPSLRKQPSSGARDATVEVYAPPPPSGRPSASAPAPAGAAQEGAEQQAHGDAVVTSPAAVVSGGADVPAASAGARPADAEPAAACTDAQAQPASTAEVADTAQGAPSSHDAQLAGKVQAVVVAHGVLMDVVGDAVATAAATQAASAVGASSGAKPPAGARSGAAQTSESTAGCACCVVM